MINYLHIFLFHLLQPLSLMANFFFRVYIFFNCSHITMTSKMKLQLSVH